MPIANNNICQNLGILLITVLWTLRSPYKMPRCVPIGQILLNSFSDILLLFSRVLKCSFTFFSKLTVFLGVFLCCFFCFLISSDCIHIYNFYSWYIVLFFIYLYGCLRPFHIIMLLSIGVSVNVVTPCQCS